MLGQKSFNKQFKQFGKSITKDAKAMEDVIHKLACLTMMPKMELSVSSADKRFGGFWEFLHFYQRTEVVEETKKLLTKPGQFFIYTKDTDKPFQRYDVAYFGQTQRLSFEIVKHKLESFNIFLDTKELLKEVTGPELMPFIINYCKGSFPNKPSILPNGIPRLGAKNVKILNELGFMQCGIPNYKMDIVEFEFKEPREGFPKRATSRKAINGTMEVTHSMLMDEALLLHKLNEKSQFFVKVLGVNYSKGTTVYFDYGISSLKCILLTHKGKIGDDYKLKWITQAAEGLKSLKEMGFLHRNINVSRYFIGEDKILKLGDCFMAKGGPHSKITDPHMNTQMKWVAPETINSLEYTYESEVWSYGVLAWCIYSEEVDPLAEVSKTQLKRMMSKRFQKTNGAHLKGFSLTMPKVLTQLLPRSTLQRTIDRPFQNYYTPEWITNRTLEALMSGNEIQKYYSLCGVHNSITIAELVKSIKILVQQKVDDLHWHLGILQSDHVIEAERYLVVELRNVCDMHAYKTVMTNLPLLFIILKVF